ncbi:Uma2 family endonuclease [Sulfuricystis multivorans]|uniref:Uma2 family endonuclease n=1 Tax=Sulfuricystis multivorans TaxID=2211108 RepID=UPI000F82472B|nr:Uma2 family endonuclease [Sulfuricystis multivorans]
MPLAAEILPVAPEDYLRHEAESPIKHEYLDGRIVAMAGAGERHNRIALNAAFRFRLASRGTRCGVFISDMKLRIEAANAFYYPDVMLVCETDTHPQYKSSPCIVVEVLSPSTAAIDRREKWLAYRTLPSLHAYLLVDSEQRAVEYWLREAGGPWRPGTLEEDEVLTLSCPPLSIAVSLDDFYEDVAGLEAG